MFSGTIPGPLRSMIRESALKWPKGTDVWVGCSGNFTIERTLADMGFKIHSNDVSIYSCALGWWRTGQEIPLTLNPESEEALGWISPYIDGGVGTVATLMLSTRFLADVGKPGGYFERNAKAYRTQYERMWNATVERLNEVTFQLESFHAKDVREYLTDDVPDDGIVVSFPPFYKGGYEKLYEAMDKHFVWEKPQYEILTEDDVMGVLDSMTNRPTWILATNHEDLDRAAHLKGYIKPALKAAPFWVYASDARTRVVHAEQKIEPVFMPRLGPADEITAESRVSLHPMSPGQFQSLRLQYMNRKIDTISTDVTPFGVAVDGKLIGLFAYGPFSGPSEMTLMTDFAVPRSRYKRLSRLILAAAVSKEARLAVERSWTRRLNSVQTAVYTDRAVSMKYRGLWDLRQRVENKPGDAFKYKITYTSKAGRWTLAEAFQTWFEKHGQQTTEEQQ